MAIGTWRDAQKVNQQERLAQRSRSKGRYISMRLKFEDRPMRFHLDRPEKFYGDYATNLEFPWKHGLAHYLPLGIAPPKFKNGLYLECGYDRCIVDAYADPERFGFEGEPDKQYRKCQAEPFFGVSGWLEEWHHVVEQTNKETGKKFNTRELCTGRGCSGCKDKAPRVFGDRKFTSFSRAQWEFLMSEIDEKASRSCRCGNYIIAYQYNCEQCSTMLVDLMNSCSGCSKFDRDGNVVGGVDVDVDPDKHKAICNKCGKEWSLLTSNDPDLRGEVNSEFECPNPECKHVGYPKVDLRCTKEGCKTDPHDIYDVSMVLRKEGEGKNKKLVIDEWSIVEPDARLFDPKHQGAGEAAVAIAKRHKEHIDLDAVFAPDPPSEMAKKLGVENPFVEARSQADRPEWKPRG